MPRAQAVKKSAKKPAGKAKQPARKPAAAKAAARRPAPKAAAKRAPAKKAPVKKAPAGKAPPVAKAPPRTVPAAAVARPQAATQPAAPVEPPRPPVAPPPRASMDPRAPAPPPRPATPPEVQPAPVAAAVRPLPEPARPVTPRPERSASDMPHYAGLTEADLLRMPTSEYMNARQLAYFRELLVSMKQQLLENADLTSEHLRENDVVPDPADRATIEEEHALELRTRDRERKLMKKIDEAIGRIDDGSYGWCEETGEAIGLPRLLARPTATLSVEAQARRELKQKLYGE